MELLIFDCDGVLIDSEMSFYDAYASSLQELGLLISGQELADRFSGISGKAIVRELAHEIPRIVPADFHKRVSERIIRRYRAGVDPMPKAAEVLVKLTTRYCVASSASPSKLALGLIQAGLYDLVYPNIFSSSLVDEPKPRPDVFLFAAREMGVSPSKCLVVEDSIAGVIAAKAAGMTVLGFVGGTHCTNGLSKKLLAAGASHTTDQLSDVQEYLRLV